MTKSMLAFVFLLMTASSASAQAPSQEDMAAIKQTALDYAEGWYAGDAARMVLWELKPEKVK